MRFHDYLDRLGSSWYLYANASNAFKDFLVWLAASSNQDQPAILMPSYIPAKLYRAALAAGYAVKFYEVHGDCRFDLDEVERQLGGQTLAVFFVHYFGFTSDIVVGYDPSHDARIETIVKTLLAEPAPTD